MSDLVFGFLVGAIISAIFWIVYGLASWLAPALEETFATMAEWLDKIFGWIVERTRRWLER